jgi:hypothetical protein
MSDLYDDDILWWSEQQAELLRRLAAGERVNDQDFIEEVEAVGGPTNPLAGMSLDGEGEAP